MSPKCLDYREAWSKKGIIAVSHFSVSFFWVWRNSGDRWPEVFQWYFGSIGGVNLIFTHINLLTQAAKPSLSLMAVQWILVCHVLVTLLVVISFLCGHWPIFQGTFIERINYFITFGAYDYFKYPLLCHLSLLLHCSRLIRHWLRNYPWRQTICWGGVWL